LLALPKNISPKFHIRCRYTSYRFQSHWIPHFLGNWVILDTFSSGCGWHFFPSSLPLSPPFPFTLHLSFLCERLSECVRRMCRHLVDTEFYLFAAWACSSVFYVQSGRTIENRKRNRTEQKAKWKPKTDREQSQVEMHSTHFSYPSPHWNLWIDSNKPKRPLI